jgi:hypothetical protein
LAVAKVDFELAGSARASDFMEHVVERGNGKLAIVVSFGGFVTRQPSGVNPTWLTVLHVDSTPAD